MSMVFAVKTLARLEPDKDTNIEPPSPLAPQSIQPFTAPTIDTTNIPTGTHIYHQPQSHPKTIARITRLHRLKAALLAAHAPPNTVREMSMRNLFAIPIIGALCLSGGALCFAATAFDVVFVLFCYTPVESGGLSFDVRLSPLSFNNRFVD